MAEPWFQRALLLLWMYVFIPKRAQEIKITTSECERVPRSQIDLSRSFANTPTSNITWRRPDGVIVAWCPPNARCVQNSGYEARIYDMWLRYALIIYTVDPAIDEGVWQMADDSTVDQVNLVLTDYLPDVHVISSGSSVISPPNNVTFTRTCASADLIISYSLRQVLSSVRVPTIMKSTNCSNGTEDSITVVLDLDQALTGNYILCYHIQKGSCTFRQLTQQCKTVVYPATVRPTTDNPNPGVTLLPFLTLLLIPVVMAMGVFVC